jgi:excisionase family DNA binding protein
MTKQETTAKEPSTYKQNIYIKGYLGLNSFDLNIDKEEIGYLINEMKKDSKFVCEYLIQKGAKIMNQKRYDKARQNLIGKKNEENGDYYTIKQISEKTSVVGSTVMRWIQNGHLKGKKSGSKWLVNKNEFDKFISDRNKETKETKEKKMEVTQLRTKKTGISTYVLLHLMQNQKMYQGAFSIHEVWKNIGEAYSFEQINAALLNLSICKKTKDNFVEKVLGRRGIFKLSKIIDKLEIQNEENFSSEEKSFSEEKFNVKLRRPIEVIENYTNNYFEPFSVPDICSKYPNVKRGSIAKLLQNGHSSVRKVGRGIYISNKANESAKVETISTEAAFVKSVEFNGIADIKSAMRVLKSMDENITVQKAKSILAERLCEMV